MDNIPDDLRATFDALFAEAVTAGEPVPTAMTLATAVDGQPSARTVLLKAFDARGFVFYTHLDGRKGRELQANPRASLLFHWPRVREGVQVRIEGDVEIVAGDEADAYFASRPRGSQVGAWASLQSETLASRETFEDRIAQFEQEFEGRGRGISSSGTARSSACTSAGCTNAARTAPGPGGCCIREWACRWLT